MSLNIDLDNDAESRLKTAALRRGVRPEVYARQIIEQHLPSNEEIKIDLATLDLLARWDAEDVTTDPEEIASRQKELEEFKLRNKDIIINYMLRNPFYTHILKNKIVVPIMDKLSFTS